MRTIDSGHLEEFKLLQQRIAYLNQTRIEVFKFYVLVVGAIFASSALIQRFDP